MMGEQKIMVPKIISMNLHTHHTLLGGGETGLFIVIMQNGISNGWQLLKFYHAAIIGAYITEHSRT